MRTIFLSLLVGLTFISCSKNQNKIENSNYKGFSEVKHNSSITSLQGDWNIDQLIESDETKEYAIYPINPDGNNHGNHIAINADQTFECGYSAFCGNDCFTNTKGKYKIIDKNYICFYLEKITKSGDCSGDSEPNKDMGLYYYYKKDKAFYWLKSSGNLEQDKKNVQYRDLIIAKRAEVEKFYRNDGYNSQMFNWKPTDYTDQQEIVASCMAKNNIKNYEMLYYDKGDIYCTMAMALVKVNGEFRYVIYDTSGEPMICLYNDSKILPIDKLVNQVDNDKSLEIKSFKGKNKPNESPSDKKTITVFKKGSEIYKVTYEDYPTDIEHSSILTIIVYFQNSVPEYIDYQYAFVGIENNYTKKAGLYVLDWQNNRVLIKNRSIGGMEVQTDRIKLEVNRIIDEIKTKNL